MNKNPEKIVKTFQTYGYIESDANKIEELSNAFIGMEIEEEPLEDAILVEDLEDLKNEIQEWCNGLEALDEDDDFLS